MRTQYHLHQQPESILGKNRLEAFSDGVFAVAITLLVLNLQSPTLLHSLVANNFIQGFGQFAPKLLAFILSFIIVGIYWVAHHNTFYYIKHSDRWLLWLNILLLLCIVFIPVPTALLGEYPEQQISIITYCSTLIVTGVVLQLLWWYATSKHRLVDKNISPRLVAIASRRNLTAPCIYLLAIGISFIAINVSLVLLALVPAFYIFPGKIDQYWGKIQEGHERQKMREISKESHDVQLEAPTVNSQVSEKIKKPVSGQTFYQKQIAALETCDINSLLSQYHPDATIIGFDFMVKGHPEIHHHFENYFEKLGSLKLKETEKYAETEDAIFFEATITSNQSEVRVYNVFLLADGKATHHFTGLRS